LRNGVDNGVDDDVDEINRATRTALFT